MGRWRERGVEGGRRGIYMTEGRGVEGRRKVLGGDWKDTLIESEGGE